MYLTFFILTLRPVLVNNHCAQTLSNIREEFPIFSQTIYGHRLAYLDSAATAQKPQCVINALTQYYSQINANVHRGVHYLSDKATLAFEEARARVQKFINAKHARECIFVRSTTEAINLVAMSFGETFIQPGDEILVSALEHHSNIVPWQMLCKRKQATLKVIPMNAQGMLELNLLDSLLTEKTKLLAITQVSNALGTVNPLKAIIAKAHTKKVKVLVDGAQSAPHLKIDVQDLGCDFFAFSGHKAYGPTGIGVLYGKEQLLTTMSPYQGGGDMILKVTFPETTYNDIPYKFEAGTPSIAEAIGLGTALTFISDLGIQAIEDHEQALLKFAQDALKQFSAIQFIGTADEKIGVISFVMDGIHAHDIGTILDQYGVLVRSGHHCAMPLMDFLDIPASVRLSFGMYNTEQDVEQCVQALKQVMRIFRKQPLLKAECL